MMCWCVCSRVCIVQVERAVVLSVDFRVRFGHTVRMR